MIKIYGNDDSGEEEFVLVNQEDIVEGIAWLFRLNRLRNSIL